MAALASEGDPVPGLEPRLSISVVIPAKNEARNIGWVLDRIPAYVDEVVVVDGLSHDGTLEVAKSISPDVVVVKELRPGKGAAMRAGFEVASGDCVIVLDADGSMDPAEIDRYVAAFEGGADLVKGSRFIAGGDSADISLLRSLGNGALLRIANTLFRTQFTELCYGFMALRRSKLPTLQLDADGFEIETQIVTRSVYAGLRVVEVPSNELLRRHGQSNLHTFRDGWRVLVTIVRERLHAHAWAQPTLVPITIEVEEASRAEAEARV